MILTKVKAPQSKITVGSCAHFKWFLKVFQCPFSLQIILRLMLIQVHKGLETFVQDKILLP